MPDLLLEFFSEEIPARMQARAAEDLKKMVTDRLVAAGLVYEGAKARAKEAMKRHPHQIEGSGWSGSATRAATIRTGQSARADIFAIT